MKQQTDLEDFLSICLYELQHSVTRKGAAFGLPVLCTNNASSPEGRVVVLREADIDKLTLMAYTDLRAKKATDLNEKSAASWTFWSKDNSLQLRVYGHTTVHHSVDLARKKWDEMPVENRKDYCSDTAPGTAIDSAEQSALPNWWGQAEKMTVENTNFGFDNFGLIITNIQKIDALHLHENGHRRAAFEQVGGAWVKTWLVP